MDGNISSIINGVIRPVLNFLFFFYDKISQAPKSTKKHQQAPKNTKRHQKAPKALKSIKKHQKALKSNN